MATGPTRTGTPLPPPELVVGQRWRRVLPGEERQLAGLRHWIASLLPACPARDDVIAVAAELGNNAVKHTLSGRGGWFAVEITWHGTVVRVAVADSGADCEPHVIKDLEAEHGRGLLVVRELSLRAGVTGDHRGRLVWADIAWDPGTAVPTTAARDPYEAAIRDGQAALARRFGGVPAWFGRATLQWWALPSRGGLVTAPTAGELAGLLYRLHHGLSSPAPDPAGGQTACSLAGPSARSGQWARAAARLPVAHRTSIRPVGQGGPRAGWRRGKLVSRIAEVGAGSRVPAVGCG